MIVDFSVTNFRSFKDEQLLSMVAETGLAQHPQNYSLSGDKKIPILKSAAIYGANASGKTTILRALLALKWLVQSSGALDEGDIIPCYEPYKLDNQSIHSYIKLEIEFILPSQKRCRYEITYDRHNILTEQLDIYSSRQKSNLFVRGIDDTWETIKFGANYKGGAKRIPLFANNSYLSKAGKNASAPEIAREIMNYFRSIRIVDSDFDVRNLDFYAHPKALTAFAKFLSYVDTGIQAITSEENQNITKNFLENSPEDIREVILNRHRLKFKFYPIEKDKTIAFEEDEVSDGTKRIFDILPLLLITLRNGSPLIVDELDGHLHTAIVELLLDIFNSSEANPLGSQIIFTTHDTNLLKSSKLRRDQIWFVEKNNGESELYSLDSFEKKIVRSGIPIEEYYLDGRFGAIPLLNKYEVIKMISAIHKDRSSEDAKISTEISKANSKKATDFL